jgi:hypothetical protein
VYAEKNYYYLNNVETGLWEVLPWDIDITFGSDHGNGNEPFRDLIVGNLGTRRPSPGPYATQFRNRLREICQLLYNEQVLFPILDGTRDLIVELAAADRDRWDNFTPLDSSPAKAHYKSLDERLAEMKAWIGKRIHQDYTDGNGVFVMSLENVYADPEIPLQPTVLSPKDGEEVVQGRLNLSCSSFADPNPNSTLRTVRWIITRQGGNELKPDWSAERPGDAGMKLEVPANVLGSGIAYQCRVRHQDETGRWSFWSQPVTFTLRPDTGIADWSKH